MKIRRSITALFMACMMMATATTCFAADMKGLTNISYSSYSGSKTTSGWGSYSGWGSGSWSWGNWGSTTKPGTGGDTVVEEDNSLEAPKIKQCRYIHQSLNAPDCLTVTWNEVEGAVSYEMELCDSRGEVIKTYTTETAGKAICANRGDSAVTGCMRGYKIRVRAIDEEGNVGKWSEYNTVGCNSVRG